MATAFRIGEISEAPNLKPEIRDSNLFFGHVEVHLKDNRSYSLIAETLARIPNGFELGSLRRIEFNDRHVVKTAAMIRVYRADIENEKADGIERGIQRLRLYPDLLFQLSDKAAIGVIVHEIAHAWLTENSGPEESQKREREADDLARKWGFGQELDALYQEAENTGGSVYG
ncbi:MAG: hypothetical protein KGH57_00525 [Candidatus Micrarchaeota archaeon]|nr:hypothetical protein [Candidatus Micrarchaeota archaeon]